MQLFNNPEAWIAIGISLLFVVVGVLMHRTVVKVLKNGSPKPPTYD